VIAVTHLEMHDPMETWWSENKKHIHEYGLRSTGHACITATTGYRDMLIDKYEESRETIRRVLLEYSGSPSWKEEKGVWIQRMFSHIRGLLPPKKAKRLDGDDLKKKLMKRCGFSDKDAEAVAQRMTGQ